jgi:hypothetical protein
LAGQIVILSVSCYVTAQSRLACFSLQVIFVWEHRVDNQYKALMIDILSDLVENHGVVACKAEFEAEGSRADGITVLTDIVRKANTGFVLKIGGGEAVRDLLDTDTYLNRRFALSHSD